MANSKQALKRVRQNIKANIRNTAHRSKMRTFIKKIRAQIAAGKREEAKKLFVEVTSVLDKLVTKGIIHANKAARTKSRLSNQIKNLESK